jgi:pyruvate dehydrogenase E2 component (dihydrolipoamide acetyltransferase)
MSIPISIPRLGWNMEEGIFGGWLKQNGDTVQPGDRLFTLESEKSTEEIECFDGGILSIPGDAPRPGDRVAVGTVIGYILAKSDAAANVTEPPASPVASAPGVASPSAPGVASPSVRRLARERGINLTEVRGSGPGGRISASDLSEPTISPRARRLAGELGVDWKQLQGSGKTGRIRERDIRDASPTKNEPAAQVVPHTAIRRTIAARMVESLRNTAPVTLTTIVDATNLVNLREQFKTSGTALSYTDLLAKLCALAIRQHPLIGAKWLDAGLQLPASINIGIAVDTDAGLLVPVVRDVDTLGLRQLAEKTRELIDLARQGKLAAADMQGGCFTISNLGNYGIDAFTPIINYPECAILGVGRIAKRPVVVGDTIVVRETLTLSLTFDHRIIDGAPAAKFLQTLSQMIENPAPVLLE